MFGRSKHSVPDHRLEIVDGGLLLEGGNAVLVECRLGSSPSLYKRFTDKHRESIDVAALTRLVEWPERLAAGDRRWLHAHCAWPTHLVHHGNVITGVLVPMATPRFLRIDHSGQVTPRNLSDLAGRPHAELLCAVGHLVRVVLRLHQLQVYVADARLENTLVDADPVSQVFQVDCDSMAGGAWQLVSPTMLPVYLREVLPEPDRCDEATDLAKLAWCLILLLLGDYSARDIDDEKQQALAAYLSPKELDVVIAATDPATYTAARSAEWAHLSHRWIERSLGSTSD